MSEPRSVSLPPGTLFLVPTPLGNLADWSPRAREVVAHADVLACEDTRTTMALLAATNLPGRELVALHDHNERERVFGLVRRLQAGATIAVVSEAGTPVVSDPGFLLVQAAVAADIPIVSLPGPSAVTAAVAASGLPVDRFAFVGFPPRKEGERETFFAELAAVKMALVVFESPRRVVDTLRTAARVLGDRRCCDAINLSKQGERLVRGTLSEVADALEADARDGVVRGEHTVVIARPDDDTPDARWAHAGPLVLAMVAAGMSPAQVRDLVAEAFGLPRREVYQRALAARDVG